MTSTVRWRIATLVVGVLVASACSGPPLAQEQEENRVWPPDGEPGDLALADTDSVDGGTSAPLIDRSGPWTVTLHHELVDDVVSIDLVAPAGAAEVQIAAEPTFGSAEWLVIADLDHATPNTGCLLYTSDAADD